MTKQIDDILAEDGAAAEAYELPEELPVGVTVTRPNQGQATIVSVRFSADEHEELRLAAEEAHLPVSTFIRVLALEQVTARGRGAYGSMRGRLERLEKAVFDPSPE